LVPGDGKSEPDPPPMQAAVMQPTQRALLRRGVVEVVRLQPLTGEKANAIQIWDRRLAGLKCGQIHGRSSSDCGAGLTNGVVCANAAERHEVDGEVGSKGLLQK